MAELQFYTQCHGNLIYKICDNCLSHKMETFLGVSMHIVLQLTKRLDPLLTITSGITSTPFLVCLTLPVSWSP